MNTTEVLTLLGQYKQRFAREYGIVALGVFGSLAHNTASEESDVDVVVSLVKPDLFAMAGIKYELEEQLHRPVDLVIYRKTMNPFLKRKIDQEAIYV